MAYNPISVNLGSYDCAEYYPNIVVPNPDGWGMDVKDDNVMQAMMRYLLNDERIKTFTYNGKKKAQIQITVDKLNRTEEKAEITKDLFTRSGTPFSDVRLGIFFDFFTDSDYSAIIEKVKTFQPDFKKMGWTYLDDVSLYIDTAGDTLVWQNEKTNGVIVFSSAKKKYQVLHMAASCLPRLFSWAFKSQPMSTEEGDLLKLLFGQKDDEFKAKMKAIYDAQDFYGRKLRAAVDGFFKGNFDNAIEAQERSIRDIDNSIDRYLSQIRDYNRQRDSENAKLIMLRNRACGTDDTEKEVVEYLTSNKSIHLLKRRDGKIYIGITCYLNDYDEDMFHSYVEKKGSSNYIYSKSPYDFDTTKALFMAIWKQRRFNLRVYCEWALRGDATVEAIGGCDMEGRKELKQDRIPQPHIDGHRCYSGYKTTLSNLASQMDYIGVLSTLLCSSACINWTDSMVVSYLMNCLFSKKYGKILEDKDGNLYTVDEAVEILKTEKKAA